jgi:hypothetical protein
VNTARSIWVSLFALSLGLVVAPCQSGQMNYSNWGPNPWRPNPWQSHALKHGGGASFFDMSSLKIEGDTREIIEMKIGGIATRHLDNAKWIHRRMWRYTVKCRDRIMEKEFLNELSDGVPPELVKPKKLIWDIDLGVWLCSLRQGDDQNNSLRNANAGFFVNPSTGADDHFIDLSCDLFQENLLNREIIDIRFRELPPEVFFNGRKASRPKVTNSQIKWNLYNSDDYKWSAFKFEINRQTSTIFVTLIDDKDSLQVIWKGKCRTANDRAF